MDLVNLSCYISLAFLAFICFLDFKKNIPKPKPVLPFNIALFLFLIANSVLYIGLLPILAGIEFNLKNYTFYWSGGDNLQLFRYREISPILIAILYFGFGKAKLEIGNKEFSFYSAILSIFRSMFPRSLGVSKKLNMYIEKLGDETNKLYSTIGKFQAIAEEYKWHLYTDEWKEIDNNKKAVENEINFLSNIKNSLNSSNINNTKENITLQIEKSRLEINENLRSYLRKIISKNIFHERSVAEIVELIDVKESDEIIVKTESNYIARAFGISFLCGILLSTVFSFTGSEYNPTERILYLVTSFFFFLSVFSFLNKTSYTVEGFSFALILGSIGGFIGHSAFNVVSGKITLFTTDVSMLLLLKTLVEKSLRGIVIGILCAGIAFVFKHKINEKIESFALKYFLSGVSGGIALVFVSYLFLDFENQIDVNTFLGPVLTGFIVMMGISFVSGIFEKSKINDQQIYEESNTDNQKKITTDKEKGLRIVS